MRIFLIGGGSGGATAPLLAVAEALSALRPKTEFYLIGTKQGVEAGLLRSAPIALKYLTIPAGKWRRYLSFANLSDVFKTAAGFVKSLYLLRKYRPHIVFGAGSFVQVPVALAAYFLKVPLVVHQQDRALLLSTRLTAPLARAVTITFLENRELPSFSGMTRNIPKSKLVLTGNPARRDLLQGSASEARKIFGLSVDFPTVLIMGGSQGSAKINQTVLAALPDLTKYVQVIHLRGGKDKRAKFVSHENYHHYGFLGPELKHAYAVADLVIGRGGMSTITELCLLGKPSILIPLPESPQVDNVAILAFLKCAIALEERFLEPERLVDLVRKILWDAKIQQTLSKNIQKVMPRDADKKIAMLLIKFAEGYKKT